MSVSRPRSAARVAGNAAPLIAKTRGRNAIECGGEHADVKSAEPRPGERIERREPEALVATHRLKRVVSAEGTASLEFEIRGAR
jgi:hypothetical protein